MSWGDLPTKPNFLAAILGFTKSQVRFVQGPNVVMFPQMKTLMPSRPDLKIWHSAHIAGSHTLPESKQNTTRGKLYKIQSELSAYFPIDKYQNNWSIWKHIAFM